ncbi:hypothetical protein [Halomarina ordinaria]|uniref:Uncharacterized protein n=1 Tax=Halomarina ordinaria TaxID=3033939 RepID=A0ABD5UA67_9EURY|nr:hypothetical protein [Halomarina sp. PSRA2]
MPHLHETSAAASGERWVIRDDEDPPTAGAIQVTPHGQRLLADAGFVDADYLDPTVVAALTALDVLYTVDGSCPTDVVTSTETPRTVDRRAALACLLVESYPPTDLVADAALVDLFGSLGALDRSTLEPFIEACCAGTPFDAPTLLDADAALTEFARSHPPAEHNPALLALFVHVAWSTAYGKTVLYLDVAAGPTTDCLCRIGEYDYFVDGEDLWSDGLAHPLRETIPGSPLFGALTRTARADVRTFFGRVVAALARAQADRTLARVDSPLSDLFRTGLAGAGLDVVALPAPTDAPAPTLEWDLRGETDD